MTAAAEWFNNLKIIQARLKDLNTDTKDNLKDFSKQKLKNLLTSQLIKDNLSQYCQKKKIGLVPLQAYEEENMNKDFLWFLGFISYSIEESILILFYQTSIDSDPNIDDPSKIKNKTIDSLYGKESLNKNSAKQRLNDILKENILVEFYPSDSKVLLDGTKTVQKVIDLILKGKEQ
jgi:hypothetical protein